jgi:hypothetical protein
MSAKNLSSPPRMEIVVQRLVRPWLLPIAFALEFVALVACAVCITVHVVFPPGLKWGDAISEAVMKLPSLKWYWPNERGEPQKEQL